MPAQLYIVVLVVLLACSNSPTGPEQPSREPLMISLQPDIRFQTIHSFGAADAWSVQFVGQNWPLNKREAMADLLFSTALQSDGSPQGIGLSSWRFNIGGGSAAQGSDSDIQDEWRRAESFLRPDGSFDGTQQAGQRWWLRAAKARGVATFTGFVNSPPVAITKNGKAYSSGGSSVNLAPENYEHYAAFLGDVINELKKQDEIELDYISPFNEPQWDWDKPNQEGTPWRNEEIAAVVRILDQQLQDRQLNTHIELPEAAQIDYLYQMYNRPGRANQIEDFFAPASKNYLGNLTSVAQKVAGHSYFTTWDTGQLISKRRALAEKLRAFPELEYWMSEYTLLENNAEVKGGGRDLGINPALYMARVIHADLTVANASAWEWWLAISPYDYKDGLIYIDLNQHDGEFYSSKMLWALGNYSRFIRPEMVRIGLTRSDGLSDEQTLQGVMASAWVDPQSGKTVLVAINYSPDTVPFALDIGGTPLECAIYRTSDTENLQFIGTTHDTQALSLGPKSITTLLQY